MQGVGGMGQGRLPMEKGEKALRKSVSRSNLVLGQDWSERKPVGRIAEKELPDHGGRPTCTIPPPVAGEFVLCCDSRGKSPKVEGPDKSEQGFRNIPCLGRDRPGV